MSSLFPNGIINSVIYHLDAELCSVWANTYIFFHRCHNKTNHERDWKQPAKYSPPLAVERRTPRIVLSVNEVEMRVKDKAGARTIVCFSYEKTNARDKVCSQGSLLPTIIRYQTTPLLAPAHSLRIFFSILSSDVKCAAFHSSVSRRPTIRLEADVNINFPVEIPVEILVDNFKGYFCNEIRKAAWYRNR